MPAPATVDEFVDLVRKSGVVEEARLKSYLQEKRAGCELPAEPNKCASIMVRDGILTFFQAEQFLLGKWKRFTIGKYKVLERLGSGGMGQVFLCEHKLMRRKVAVKVLPTAKAEDPSALERFQREARAVAALDHPNIVRAYDIDQDDNLHFLVMEYVDGASFQDIIKKHGKMDATRACHYMYWSAIGLQHAHEKGLIHRDIKPGNILIDRMGTVKILDMGLARFFNDDEDMLTKKYDENVLGTADYLAPEQAIDSHSVDGRADIYSLGATFYFLLVGHQPFLEGTIAQKLIWHQNRNPPKSIKEVRSDVPDEVIAIIDKMMAKNRADRYQDPAELAEALYPFVQTPIDPPPEKEMPQLSAAALATGSVTNSMTGVLRTSSVSRAITPIPRVVPSQPGSGSTGQQAQNGETQRGNPTAVPAPAPIIETTASGNPVWESFEDDANTSSRDDTQKQPPAQSKSRTKPGSSRRLTENKHAKHKKTGFPLLPVLIVLALAVAASASVWWFALRDGKEQDVVKQGNVDRSRVTVSKHAGLGQFSRISEAINHADPGTHIVLLDEEWQESLTISAPPKGLVIKAEDGKQVVWKPEKGKEPNQLLLISKAENLTVRGIRFEGEGRIQTCIRISGKCPGMTLEDLEFSKFTRSCLSLVDCEGTEKRPVLMQRLRCQSQNQCESGIYLGVTEATPISGQTIVPNKNESIDIRDCRFEGSFKSAIRIDGSAMDLDIIQNRFWQCEDGIYFKEPKSEYNYQIKIQNNTFMTLKKAIHFQRANEILQAGVKIVLSHNYFYNTVEGIVSADDNPPELKFLQGIENARNSGSPEGKPIGSLAPFDIALPDDPKDEKRFLRYDRNSPLFKAANGKPVGVPPVDLN